MNNSKVKHAKACPKCAYNLNPANAELCEICQTSLKAKAPQQDEARILRNTHRPPSKIKRIPKKAAFNSVIEQTSQKLKNNLSKFQDKKSLNQNLEKLQKPVNLLGLFFVSLGIMLWVNYIFVTKTQNVTRIQVQKLEKEDEYEIPQGLFNYGGAPIFAPLVASGINGRIEKKYPGYELRYAKPINRDYSSFNGIKMLLDGELSFAYNERSLTEEEYKSAKLRNVNLKQIPIALDGVVVYGNQQLEITKLNREQLRKIFLGEITNWNDINPKIEDLPIVPVIVTNEDLQLLGLTNQNQSLSDKTEMVDNYTLALRKVIATPGSVSFSSISIVKNQQLIKMFALADGNSGHIRPVVDGKANIDAVKSGAYPLTRRIFLVYREDDTLDQEAGKLYGSYLTSAEGQNFISKVGLVPIANYKLKSPKKLPDEN